MTEEPTVERAIQEIMTMLGEEVPKSLLTFWVSSLHAEAASQIAEIEAQLHRPTATFIENSINEAREDVEVASGEWLEAWSHRLRAVDG